MQDRQTILISDVPVMLHLGVSAAERACAQQTLIGVHLEILDPPDFESAALDDTIDYDQIITFITGKLPDFGPTPLIETLAERVAAFSLALSPRIVAAHVEVKKPSVLPAPGRVSVRLSRFADAVSRRQALRAAP